MKKFANWLALGMLLVVVTVLAGCGGGGNANNSQGVDSAQKTGSVNMYFDLNSRQNAKTVYGGLLPAVSILQEYKNEITHVDVYVQTMDNVDVVDFENLPIINGVFSSMNTDGTSKINLPEGSYHFWVDCDNSNHEARFSGQVDVTIVAGGPNNVVIDMSLNNIYVDLAIMSAPGNFEKSDGSFMSGIYYDGTANTDDGISFSSDEIAYADLNGVLHVTIEVNPLTTNTVWINVTDKDGKVILQKIDLDMPKAVQAERTDGSYWYTYQKTDPVNITFNFPQ